MFTNYSNPVVGSIDNGKNGYPWGEKHKFSNMKLLKMSQVGPNLVETASEIKKRVELTEKTIL